MTAPQPTPHLQAVPDEPQPTPPDGAETGVASTAVAPITAPFPVVDAELVEPYDWNALLDAAQGRWLMWIERCKKEWKEWEERHPLEQPDPAPWRTDTWEADEVEAILAAMPESDPLPPLTPACIALGLERSEWSAKLRRAWPETLTLCCTYAEHKGQHSWQRYPEPDVHERRSVA